MSARIEIGPDTVHLNQSTSYQITVHTDCVRVTAIPDDTTQEESDRGTLYRGKCTVFNDKDQGVIIPPGFSVDLDTKASWRGERPGKQFPTGASLAHDVVLGRTSTSRQSKNSQSTVSRPLDKSDLDPSFKAVVNATVLGLDQWALMARPPHHMTVNNSSVKDLSTETVPERFGDESDVD